MLLLDEYIHAKAREAGNGKREVALELLAEIVALTLVHHRVGELAGDRAGEFLAGQRLDVARGSSCSAENRSQ